MVIELNNLYSKVIMEEKDMGNPIRFLSKHMRVKMPGSQFMNLENSDGCIRFINKEGKFLTGFLKEVVEICSEDFEISFKDFRTLNIPQTFDLTVKGLDLRDDQEPIVLKCFKNKILDINFPRGIIDTATNSGKSFVITSIVKSIKRNTLVLVHRKNVFNELHKLLKVEFGDKLGIVEGKSATFGLVTLAMVKKLANLNETSAEAKFKLSGMSVVICDESHRAEHLELLYKLHCPFRYLFSGSHSDIRNPILKAKMIGLSGPVLVKLRNQFYIDKGISQRPIVKIYLNQVPFHDRRPVDYDGKYVRGIIRSANRLQVISDYIEDNPEKYILIATKRKEHAALIGKFLEAPYIHSGSADRDEQTEKFEKGEIKILVSTVITQESSNLPLINALVYGIGEFSKISLKQFIGRAIRDDKVHKTVDIIDFFDQDYGPLRIHSKRRLKIYEDEGFEIIFMYKAQKNGEPTKAQMGEG